MSDQTKATPGDALHALPTSQMLVDVWDSEVRGRHQANAPYYTADQMREFARASIAAASPMVEALRNLLGEYIEAVNEIRSCHCPERDDPETEREVIAARAALAAAGEQEGK